MGHWTAVKSVAEVNEDEDKGESDCEEEYLKLAHGIMIATMGMGLGQCTAFFVSWGLFFPFLSTPVIDFRPIYPYPHILFFMLIGIYSFADGIDLFSPFCRHLSTFLYLPYFLWIRAICFFFSPVLLCIFISLFFSCFSFLFITYLHYLPRTTGPPGPRKYNTTSNFQISTAFQDEFLESGSENNRGFQLLFPRFSPRISGSGGKIVYGMENDTPTTNERTSG